MSATALGTAGSSSPRTPAGPARADSAAPGRLRITRRGRAVLTTIAALPVVAVALVLALNGGGANATDDGAAGSSSSASSFEYVTVDSGATLWSLAESLEPTADPRDVVAAIVELNGLASAEVHPGQQLAVPAVYAD